MRPDALHIDIAGIHCRQGREAASRRLSTTVTDPSGRLGLLRMVLHIAFESAGFMGTATRILRNTLSKSGRVYWADDDISSALPVLLLDMPSSKHVIPCKYNPGKFRHPPERVDLRAVLSEFQNHTWATKVPLQKISLCRMDEMGIRRTLARCGGGIDSDVELFEEFSVPIPCADGG